MARHRMSTAGWSNDAAFVMEPLVPSATHGDAPGNANYANLDPYLCYSTEEGSRRGSSLQTLSKPPNDHLDEHIGERGRGCMAGLKRGTQRLHQNLNYFVNQWWGWEVLALLFSSVCIMAVAILLYNVHDRPLSQWPFTIAPNTLVSIFTTVAKSSALVAVTQALSQLKWDFFRPRTRPLYNIEAFNEASRGPWGALLFTYRTGGRALMASGAALIIVLALAMDSFAQQILTFKTKPPDVDKIDPATWMPYTFAYLPGYNGETDLQVYSGKLD